MIQTIKVESEDERWWWRGWGGTWLSRHSNIQMEKEGTKDGGSKQIPFGWWLLKGDELSALLPLLFSVLMISIIPLGPSGTDWEHFHAVSGKHSPYIIREGERYSIQGKKRESGKANEHDLRMKVFKRISSPLINHIPHRRPRHKRKKGHPHPLSYSAYRALLALIFLFRIPSDWVHHMRSLRLAVTLNMRRDNESEGLASSWRHQIREKERLVSLTIKW